VAPLVLTWPISGHGIYSVHFTLDFSQNSSLFRRSCVDKKYNAPKSSLYKLKEIGIELF